MAHIVATLPHTRQRAICYRQTNILAADDFACVIPTLIPVVADCVAPGMAPVPLTLFRSNSKFDNNLDCTSLIYA